MSDYGDPKDKGQANAIAQATEDAQEPSASEEAVRQRLGKEYIEYLQAQGGAPEPFGQPMTDERLAGLHRWLDGPGRSDFARPVIAELVAEVDRLRAGTDDPGYVEKLVSGVRRPEQLRNAVVEHMQLENRVGQGWFCRCGQFVSGYTGSLDEALKAHQLDLIRVVLQS